MKIFRQKADMADSKRVGSTRASLLKKCTSIGFFIGILSASIFSFGQNTEPKMESIRDIIREISVREEIEVHRDLREDQVEKVGVGKVLVLNEVISEMGGSDVHKSYWKLSPYNVDKDSFFITTSGQFAYNLSVEADYSQKTYRCPASGTSDGLELFVIGDKLIVGNLWSCGKSCTYKISFMKIKPLNKLEKLCMEISNE